MDKAIDTVIWFMTGNDNRDDLDTPLFRKAFLICMKSSNKQIDELAEDVRLYNQKQKQKEWNEGIK